MIAFTFGLAMGFALAHLMASRLRFLYASYRSRWLSVAGGVAVAYVFVHLLPELSAHQQVIEELANPLADFLEHHVYLAALFGLAAFYGLEHAARTSRRRGGGVISESSTEPAVFWVHVGAFSLYSALISYLLLHRDSRALPNLLLYFVAMALHFVVNDFALRDHHKGEYDRIGRWVLAFAILLGWWVGVMTVIPEWVVSLLDAFVAGAIILNVIKEELPGERQSQFGPFLAGATLYAAVLLVV